MYLQFPIDLSSVAKDHPFLEADPLQSLYRRLVALNRCATMRLDNAHHGKHHQAQQREREDSDDDSCALSENWTFEPQGRRWSRVGENMGLPLAAPPSPGATSSKQDTTRSDISSRESSPESMEGYGTLPTGPSKFRRTGSERLKDGAKAFLRRVESIKTRRKKRQHRDGLVISGPQVLDFGQMNQKMSDLKCVDVSSYPNSPLPPNTPIKGADFLKVPGAAAFEVFDENQLRGSSRSKQNFCALGRVHGTQSHRTSPLHFGKSGDDSSTYYSDSQDSGTVQTSSSAGSMRKKSTKARKFFQRSKVEDAGALSDSECNARKVVDQAGTDPMGNELKVPGFTRGGSLNLGRDSNKYRDKLKNRSLRSRSLRKSEKYVDSDKEDEIVLRVNKSNVVRWHSFQTAAEKAANRTSGKRGGMPLMGMSCGQLQVVRKLGLVTLTGYMERYCPTHRSGWNWELPKFIKKIKMPDYKDKRVFGLPLVVTLQRSGQALPKTIQAAMNWLNVNAIDQIGLFRKSGVKSRIAKVKAIVETSPDCDSLELFEGQQPYDVADMIKQYFRDLPESLFTNKLAETFIAIFQHLPEEVRADAIQSAILLLPDENREVLYVLLHFLGQVAENAMFNQMTVNNLAVCLAPSVFHVGMSSPVRSTSVSPRRKKATGVPDARELSETKASHECLAFMISNLRSLFIVPHEKIARCNFSYMEESKPVPLSELGKGMDLQDWRAYLDQCTSAIMKEGRERPRGWISAPTMDPNVEVFYKKVGDGHPLRLWKTCVEVEAPPSDVCQFIIKERNLWDPFFVDSRVVEQLDEKSEIFQYVCGGHMLSDYCVLRSWRTNLPKGACVIVETSVDHGSAQLLGPHANSVRGVVLASRYLIEPCGGGKSKIMHLARVDTKGRTPEWYNKCYGHICSQYLSRIRNGFKHVVANGPESKV